MLKQSCSLLAYSQWVTSTTIGTEDKVIPKEVASSFVAQLESSAKCAGIVEVKAGHQTDW